MFVKLQTTCSATGGSDRPTTPPLQSTPANDPASTRWLDPTTNRQMASHNRPPRPHFTTLNSPKPITHLIHLITSVDGSRLVQRHPPSYPVPCSCPPRAFPFNLSSASFSYASLLLHPKKEHPLRLLVSLLLHLFSLLIWAGIEPHPGPVQDQCSVCGDRVHAGWVAFLCIVCDQWCPRLCFGIHSPIDYRRLAPWSCPTCSTPVPPAAPTTEQESSDLERTRLTLTLSFGDSLSHRSLSIRSSPPALTSTAAPGHA